MLGIALVLVTVYALSCIRAIWAIWKINRELRQLICQMESLRPAQSGKVISLLEVKARKVKGA